MPPNENKRLAAVERYAILDTPPDGAFDRITRLAARIFGVPIAIISIVHHDRIWFKSHHGIEAEQIEREPGLRFYAGAPLTTRDGYNLGTLNVIGTRPREVSEDELATLQDLAAIVVEELEMRLAARAEADLVVRDRAT